MPRAICSSPAVDDMIISGGENISPAEIESVLSLHPAVAEVAVAGLPDERWGQRVAAFVKRVGTVDGAALDAWCRQSSLADYKRPREYVFVVEIPKSPVGKILRRLLVAGEYRTEGFRPKPRRANSDVPHPSVSLPTICDVRRRTQLRVERLKQRLSLS
jgi:acyl-CoA synthetase (AMP-forming)/AMP-acid ligase II